MANKHIMLIKEKQDATNKQTRESISIFSPPNTYVIYDAIDCSVVEHARSQFYILSVLFL